MDRRAKATLNRDRAKRLIEEWQIDALQGRYSHNGHWYATLTRFPAVLFDANGYIRFSTEEAYLTSPYLRIGKQISIRQPGISAIPGYVVVDNSDASSNFDVDIHSFVAVEGQHRVTLHLQRERNQTIVRKKKAQAASLDCEVCGFSFGHVYGTDAMSYCEVHHLLPLSEIESETQIRLKDLAILCANCHRVVHLRNPPYTLDQVREMLVRENKDTLDEKRSQ